jgi:hypothetical protein
MPLAVAIGKTHLADLGVKQPTMGWTKLLADAEFRNYSFVPLRVVLLEVVEQATTPADHHQKSTARAVIFQVRFEVFRQLTDALAQQRDLNFWASGIGGMRAVRVNDGLLLLSG